MDFFDDDKEQQTIPNSASNVDVEQLVFALAQYKRKILLSVIISMIVMVLVFSLVFVLTLQNAVKDVQTEGEKLLSSIERAYYLPENVEMISNSVYSQCVDGVIEISCRGQAQGTSYESSATGIILNSQGYVLTNAHVITFEYSYKRSGFGYSTTQTSTAEYTSILGNYADSDTTFELSIIAYDTDLDLAILKLRKTQTNLKPLKLGDSSYLNYGEDAIVIGNAEGFGLSITEGIISNPFIELEQYSSGLVMTSAAINPGNSGGPLFNVYGELMGVITSKIASEENEGLGFAIPSNVVKSYIENVENTKRITIDTTLSYRGEIQE